MANGQLLIARLLPLRLTMLFVLDVGNTNTVLGVFGPAENAPAAADAAPRYDRLVANWRVATRQGSTVDEYGVLFRNLFSMANLLASGIHGIVISSVVPPLDPVPRKSAPTAS